MAISELRDRVRNLTTRKSVEAVFGKAAYSGRDSSGWVCPWSTGEFLALHERTGHFFQVKPQHPAVFVGDLLDAYARSLGQAPAGAHEGRLAATLLVLMRPPETEPTLLPG